MIRIKLRYILAGSMLALSLVTLAQTKSPPNIVVIICDDMNDTIAGMGKRRYYPQVRFCEGH
jgi:hypothetical protein